MPSRAYHRFVASFTPDTLTSGLADLGIVIRERTGDWLLWTGDGVWWKQIGRIAVVGALIELWPYRKITDADMDVLRGAGFEAAWNPPSEETHWTPRFDEQRGHWWDCTISVSVDDMQRHEAQHRRRRHSRHSAA